MFGKWNRLSVIIAMLGFGDCFTIARAQNPKDITSSNGIRFKFVPAGSFKMGSPTSENGSEDDERQHDVIISKSFYLSAYEVTQEQYSKVMGENPSRFQGENAADRIPAKKDPQTDRTIEDEKIIPKDTSAFPVERVSWEEAVEFCKRLSDLPDERNAGRTYRLPREAEWEYACRAGTETAYFFGDNATAISQYAWYEKNSSSHPHPVGTKKPNGFGIYDLYGNVSEWCWDNYGEYPRNSVTDPTGALARDLRVTRGGSFSDRHLPDLRSAKRDSMSGDYHLNTIGIRVVMTPSGIQSSNLASMLFGKWAFDFDETKKRIKLSSTADLETMSKAQLTFEFSSDNMLTIDDSKEKAVTKYEIIEQNESSKFIYLQFTSGDRENRAKTTFIDNNFLLMETGEGSVVLKKLGRNSPIPENTNGLGSPPARKLQIDSSAIGKITQYLTLESEIDELIKANKILVANRLPASVLGDEYIVLLKREDAQGSVWGSGPYTLDSNLRSAAIHAGVIPPGAAGLVRVVCVKSPDSFSASSRNGISSSSYGKYELAFQIHGLAEDSSTRNDE
jgi:formylglycine-generating enzyme required for sulfatase activity